MNHARKLIWMWVCCTSVAWAFEEITPEQTRSAERAMQWMVKAQNADGSWGMDIRTPSDIAATSMAAMALLAAGNTDRDGPDPACVKAVKKAVDYLLMRARKMRPGGDIAEGEQSEMQTYVGQRTHTFFATIFLSQIYGSRCLDLPPESYSEIKGVLIKLTDSISSSQDADGSWHKETYSSLQATAFAWMALRSAGSCGVPIKHAAVTRVIKFIKSQYNPPTHLFGRNNTNQIYATASAMRIVYGMGDWDEPQNKAAADTMLKSIADVNQGFLTNCGEDFLASTLVTHALIKQGGDRWKTWFTFVRTRLLRTQNGDGSWTATSCLRGRTFPTACALLCLHTPSRLLPIQDL